MDMEQYFFSKNNFNLLYNIIVKKIKSKYNYTLENYDLDFPNILFGNMKNMYKIRGQFIPRNTPPGEAIKMVNKKILDRTIIQFSNQIRSQEVSKKRTNNNPVSERSGYNISKAPILEPPQSSMIKPTYVDNLNQQRASFENLEGHFNEHHKRDVSKNYENIEQARMNELKVDRPQIPNFRDDVSGDFQNIDDLTKNIISQRSNLDQNIETINNQKQQQQSLADETAKFLNLEGSSISNTKKVKFANPIAEYEQIPNNSIKNQFDAENNYKLQNQLMDKRDGRFERDRENNNLHKESLTKSKPIPSSQLSNSNLSSLISDVGNNPILQTRHKQDSNNLYDTIPPDAKQFYTNSITNSIEKNNSRKINKQTLLSDLHTSNKKKANTIQNTTFDNQIINSSNIKSENVLSSSIQESLKKLDVLKNLNSLQNLDSLQKLNSLQKLDLLYPLLEKISNSKSNNSNYDKIFIKIDNFLKQRIIESTNLYRNIALSLEKQQLQLHTYLKSNMEKKSQHKYRLFTINSINRDWIGKWIIESLNSYDKNGILKKKKTIKTLVESKWNSRYQFQIPLESSGEQWIKLPLYENSPTIPVSKEEANNGKRGQENTQGWVYQGKEYKKYNPLVSRGSIVTTEDIFYVGELLPEINKVFSSITSLQVVKAFFPVREYNKETQRVQSVYQEPFIWVSMHEFPYKQLKHINPHIKYDINPHMKHSLGYLTPQKNNSGNYSRYNSREFVSLTTESDILELSPPVELKRTTITYSNSVGDIYSKQCDNFGIIGIKVIKKKNQVCIILHLDKKYHQEEFQKDDKILIGNFNLFLDNEDSDLLQFQQFINRDQGHIVQETLENDKNKENYYQSLEILGNTKHDNLNSKINKKIQKNFTKGQHFAFLLNINLQNSLTFRMEYL